MVATLHRKAALARQKSFQLLAGHPVQLPQPEPGDWTGGVNVWKVTDRLWRMARNTWLEPTGWEAAAAQGVALNIDLRAPAETLKDPLQFTQNHVPIQQLALEDPGLPDYVALCHRENIPYPNSAKYYPQMLEWFGPRITGILNTIASTDGAVVINCSAGRDRTGLISYLVMLLGGANDEEMLGLHAASCAGINAWHMVSGIPHPFEYGRDGEDYLGWITDHIDQLQRFLDWYRSTDYQQTLLAAGLREESLAKLLPR